MTQTDRGQRTQTDSETDDERDTSETEEEEAEAEAEEEAEEEENQNDKLNQAIASLFGRGRISRGARGRGRGGRRDFSVRLPPPMNSHDVNTTTPPIRGRPGGVRQSSTTPRVRSRGSNIPNQSTQPTTSSTNGLRAQIVLIIIIKKQKKGVIITM